eukprot:10021138-Lingulodinium_polyedra.AAC.1
MMPPAVQDYIYMLVEKDTQYLSLKERARAVVANNIAIEAGPAPMDVGEATGDNGGDDWEVDA